MFINQGFNLKSGYLIAFKEYKDKIKAESLGKNAKIYEEHENLNEFEQKPIKIHDFAKEKEKEISENLKRENKKDAKQLKKTKS